MLGARKKRLTAQSLVLRYRNLDLGERCFGNNQGQKCRDVREQYAIKRSIARVVSLRCAVSETARIRGEGLLSGSLFHAINANRLTVTRRPNGRDCRRVHRGEFFAILLQLW